MSFNTRVIMQQKERTRNWNKKVDEHFLITRNLSVDNVISFRPRFNVPVLANKRFKVVAIISNQKKETHH